jgi:hypothetical protein
MAPSCFMKVSMQTANPALHLTRRNVGLDSRRAFKSLFPVRHAGDHSGCCVLCRNYDNLIFNAE